ncbi:MAG: phosphoenolpyruvate carboxylase [Pseudomonadota bacterium]
MADQPSSAAPSISSAQDALKRHAASIEDDPQTNSVFAYALDLFQALENNTLQIDDLEQLVHELFVALIDERTNKFRIQHASDTLDAWANVRSQLDTLATAGWDTFQSAMETPRGGIVFTGHPTFALSQSVRSHLANQMSSPSENHAEALRQALFEDGRVWSSAITLEGEHKEAQNAIGNAQIAIRQLAELIFDTAAAHFPDDWQKLRPRLPTLASWIGYDLDGRTDIHWSQSFTFRLREKALQLDTYARRVAEIADAAGDVIEPQLIKLRDRLKMASSAATDEANLFSKDLTDPDNLVAAANALTAPNDARLTSTSSILDVVDSILASDGIEIAIAKHLFVFRCEVNTLQLGTSRIHLRLNAEQIGSVISRDLKLETENRDPGRRALAELSRLAEESKPLPVSFADLFLQQSTARRQFMMCAQILKHIDSDSSIRFLIAESENPSTVMGALYLARQYGVDHDLDISPLFETPEALETGGRFIEQLLAEPTYLEYLRSRGYLSIQLGFSDAGRFIGQVAADMAIERIHNLISRAVCRAGKNLELLIFNTHGESMGRGAWPGSFEQRFNHLLTPWTRLQSAKREVPIRHEVSFQGGDGFLHFATERLAVSTMAAFATHLLSRPDGETAGDPFYSRTDLVWDFYRALRRWHERLFDDEDYGRMLIDFGTGFLVKAGSRERRRASGPSGPRSLRAISNNATLQQLGVPLNTAAGIGSALRREQDQVNDLIRKSPRMRSLIKLASIARSVTSVPALRAYAEVFNPSFWVALARTTTDENTLAYRRIYYLLQDRQTTNSIEKIANKLSIDLSKFDPMLAEMESVPSPEQRHEDRLLLHTLHAIRQALMMKALSLAGRLPTVSRRHEDSVIDIMNMIKTMQIGDAVLTLKKIFPASRDRETALEAVTETGHMTGNPANGFDELHSEIIDPLDQIDRQLHTITLAVSQAYRAYG